MHIPPPPQAKAFEGFADTPQARLWFWDTGGGGEALVLCHPASQSCRIWGYQQPFFSAAGYRVIAYSRRGHYRSEVGADEERGTSVGDLINLLDSLNVERAHLLGAAAGGITAMGCTVAHPHRVLTLSLVGTIVSPDEQEWRELYGRLGLAAVRSVVSTEFLELGPSYRAAEPDGTARFAQLAAEAKPRGPVQQAIGSKVKWRDMEQVIAPTLLVTGEADLYAPPPLQDLIGAHLPSSERATIREVGHAAYWEAPNTLNELVLDFLRRSGTSKS